MSFILDALRRADADRTRGSVPGLGTQAVGQGHATALESDGLTRRVPSWPWWLLGGFGLLTVGGGLVWVGLARPPAKAPLVATSAVGGGAVPEANPRVVASLGLAPALSVPPPLLVQGDTSGSGAPQGAPEPGQVVRPQAPERQPAVVGANTSAMAAVRVAELPADIRQLFPSVKAGGGMYSPQAQSRLVVLNDQVWREGDTVAPGVTVLEIKPNSVVLGFRQHKVVMPF